MSWVSRKNKHMRKSETAFTDRQDTIIRQMKAGGYSDDSISERLGRTKQAISARWKLLRDRDGAKVLRNQYAKGGINPNGGQDRPDSASVGSTPGPVPCPAVVPLESVDQPGSA